MSESRRAVILVSGGLDSTTVLALARSQGYACYTLSFDYGQRHRAELLAAERVSAALGSYWLPNASPPPWVTWSTRW
jgi:7-cyano-7-deazaguanine synthase